jgi:radical SAM superfamily enzyme YgiQ (UPF0313 family)
MSEGDETIVELLHALSHSAPLEQVKGICFLGNGRIVRTEGRPLIKDISVLSMIDYPLFDPEKYIETSKYIVSDPLPIPREEVRLLPINTARGCIAKCRFCYHVFKGTQYRFRNPESIVREVRSLIDTYSLNFIVFSDELTFFSKKQTVALVERILEEGVHFYWGGTCRGNLFDDEGDLEIMEKIRGRGVSAWDIPWNLPTPSYFER